MWKSLSYMLEWQTAVVDNWIKHDFAIDDLYYFYWIFTLQYFDLDILIHLLFFDCRTCFKTFLRVHHQTLSQIRKVTPLCSNTYVSGCILSYRIKPSHLCKILIMQSRSYPMPGFYITLVVMSQ